MIFIPLLSTLILICFIVYIIVKFKNRPTLSILLLLTLGSRLLGLFIYFYVIRSGATPIIAKARFWADDITYIGLIMLMMYLKFGKKIRA